MSPAGVGRLSCWKWPGWGRKQNNRPPYPDLFAETNIFQKRYFLHSWESIPVREQLGGLIPRKPPPPDLYFLAAFRPPSPHINTLISSDILFGARKKCLRPLWHAKGTMTGHSWCAPPRSHKQAQSGWGSQPGAGTGRQVGGDDHSSSFDHSTTPLQGGARAPAPSSKEMLTASPLPPSPWHS